MAAGGITAGTSSASGTSPASGTASAARAGSAVRSIAATLCDLSGVTAVRLSVIGESGLTYYDISEPITPQPDWFSE